MKTHVIKIEHMGGVGKESGRAFDMKRVSFLQPMERSNGEKFRKEGSGFDVIEADCSEEVWVALREFADLEFPMLVDLDVQLRVNGRDNSVKPFAAGVVIPGKAALKAAA